MGCGCGKKKNNALKARKAAVNAGVISNRVSSNLKNTPAQVRNPELEEKRAKERQRRDAILKALRRP